MKVALLQFCGKTDYRENLNVIAEHAKKAKAQNAEVLILPECFYSMNDGVNPTPYPVEYKEGTEHFENIRKLAREFNLYLLGGTCATVNPRGREYKLINRTYNFDPDGNPLPYYDKMNLFACNIPGTNHDENLVYEQGSTPLMWNHNQWKIGFSVCFDLRFPQMYRNYSKEGANVFIVTAAFTYATGKAHWETLLKARAIENQAYVLACNQIGTHNSKTRTWGHTMVIDPWGEIIASAHDDEENLLIADLNIDRVTEIRQRMKVL